MKLGRMRRAGGILRCIRIVSVDAGQFSFFHANLDELECGGVVMVGDTSVL